MAKLVQSKETIAVLQKSNFQFKKQFGQNFLIDPSVLEHILDFSAIGKEDLVIEIGPGIGTLTEALCERSGFVVAVEIDDKLIPILEENLAPCRCTEGGLSRNHCGPPRFPPCESRSEPSLLHHHSDSALPS